LPAGVPATLDELKAASGLEPGPLLGALGELEIRGEVRRLPGALYIRA
jgi:predicted Rossmann fold nucleotide-binding protein DprA/Smf involved in DNA uptake